VPRVLHDTDPTTKTGLDQIQNTDRAAVEQDLDGAAAEVEVRDRA
jgi:hypothetical protein